MNKEGLKESFEDILDLLPKNDSYFQNVTKLIRIFREIEEQVDIDHIKPIEELGSEYEPNGFKTTTSNKQFYWRAETSKCECSLDNAVAKVIKQFTIDPQFKHNQKNNISSCVIEEVDNYLKPDYSSVGLRNAIKVGASKYINELIERTNPNGTN